MRGRDPGAGEGRLRCTQGKQADMNQNLASAAAGLCVPEQVM